MLSGWYGVGSGIKAFLDVRKERGLDLLRRMFDEARLFRLILDDVERTLLQVDMSIAGEYADLVQDELGAPGDLLAGQPRVRPDDEYDPARSPAAPASASAFRNFAAASHAA